MSRKTKKKKTSCSNGLTYYILAVQELKYCYTARQLARTAFDIFESLVLFPFPLSGLHHMRRKDAIPWETFSIVSFLQWQGKHFRKGIQFLLPMHLDRDELIVMASAATLLGIVNWPRLYVSLNTHCWSKDLSIQNVTLIQS